MVYIIFDTETTGKPDKEAWRVKPHEDLNLWHMRMTQLAFQVMNEEGELIYKYENLIYPDGWVMPLEDWFIKHGFSQTKNEEQGVPLLDALMDLVSNINAYEEVGLVSHNMAFDFSVLQIELMYAGAKIHGLNAKDDLTASGRLKLMLKPNKRVSKFCTKEISTSVVKIPNPYYKKDLKGERIGSMSEFKWAKLEELYEFLFNEKMDGYAHDAMWDTKACARCFFELKKRGFLNNI